MKRFGVAIALVAGVLVAVHATRVLADESSALMAKGSSDAARDTADQDRLQAALDYSAWRVWVNTGAMPENTSITFNWDLSTTRYESGNNHDINASGHFNAEAWESAAFQWDKAAGRYNASAGLARFVSTAIDLEYEQNGPCPPPGP